MADHEKLPHINCKEWNFLTEDKNKSICSKFTLHKIKLRNVRTLRIKSNDASKAPHKPYIRHKTKPIDINIDRSYINEESPGGNISSIGLGRFDKLMFPNDFCDQWSKEYRSMKKRIRNRQHSKTGSACENIEFNLPQIHDTTSPLPNRYLDIMEHMKESDFNCKNRQLDIIKPQVNGNDRYTSCFRRLITDASIRTAHTPLPPETRIRSKLDLLIQRYGN